MLLKCHEHSILSVCPCVKSDKDSLRAEVNRGEEVMDEMMMIVN